MSGNHLLFFAHGMQVEVPLGTVLCFNPLSLSSDELRELTDVEVWVGSSSRSSSIIFQTKLAVFTMDSAPQSLFAGQITFQSRRQQGQPQGTGTKQEIILENTDWIEFLPILFDYLRRKYDGHRNHHNNLKTRLGNNYDDVIVPYTHCLSFEQLHHFQLACDYYGIIIPGMFENNQLTGFMDMNLENNMIQVLAKKECFGENTHYYHNKQPLIDSIRRNDLDLFRFLLLNRTNRLSFKRQQIEHDLLWIFCILDVTKERLDMLMTVFDPNQFGGRFFYTPENQMPNLFTDLARINRRPMIPITGPERPVEDRFHDLRQIVRCLVNSLWIPLYNGFETANGFEHLLDYCREIGSWMGYTIFFLEYFPEWRRCSSSKYIVAGEGALSMFRPGDHVNADLPFFLSQLLPSTSPEELVRAEGQYRSMKDAIHNPRSYHSTSDRTTLPILSEMLNTAIAQRGGDFHP